MKRISILLVLSSMLMVLVSTGWCQITHLTSYYRAYTNTNCTEPIAPQSIITVQLVLTVSTTLSPDGTFLFDGVDPVTDVGMQIVDLDNTSNAFWNQIFPGGVHQGALVQIIGSIDPYFNILQFQAGTQVGVGSPETLSLLTCLGIGYATPTTFIPNLASCTTVDTTAQTGGESLIGKVVRINNVSINSTYSQYTAQLVTHGVFTTGGRLNGILPLVDSSIANVTTLTNYTTSGGAPIYPNYSSLTDLMFMEFTESNISTLSAVPSRMSTFVSIVTAMPFNIVGVFDKSSYVSPGTLNPQTYWVFVRGDQVIQDITPYIAVSPGTANTQPGGPTIPFTATGGFPPYTWSLSNPVVGSINSTSGVFTASSTRGVSNVIATDSKGYPATVVGVVTNTATSAPLAPDISMDSMAIPKVTDRMGIASYEFYER